MNPALLQNNRVDNKKGGVKIVVLSDTHIPQVAEELPSKIYDELKSADLLLHAGDITSLIFLKNLQKLVKEIKAVYGNMDELGLRKILPRKEVIKVNGFSIGLIHGWGAPSGLIDLAEKEFQEKKPDIIIFGHSHQPLSLNKNGILFFNPGSPTDKVFSGENSYGIILIDDRIDAKIVRL
ncbi:MAG: hypothetical protein A3J51_05655 [Omnitrophica WOR_2 bacterium RIFCSPHIGHO2_02_FULL_45_21]|nr:MAG: hypothetical protein A3J51_05655 [Omnitrophica WOR_2 bacterium RIFCSPHIGHO2_02_FULL_45_21]